MFFLGIYRYKDLKINRLFYVLNFRSFWFQVMSLYLKKINLLFNTFHPRLETKWWTSLTVGSGLQGKDRKYTGENLFQ